MSMPRNRTPRIRVSRATRASTGASSRHGTHQEPQKLTTMAWPRQLLLSRRPPPRAGPEMSGAIGRCASGMTWPTAGSPGPFASARRTAPMVAARAAAVAAAPSSSRARLFIGCLLFPGVGEPAAGQVIGVDQDLVGELVGRAVRADGELD